MFGNKQQRGQDERLDALGRAVVRASAANEAEAEAVAAAPFLYARLRARIAAEQARRDEGESWLTLFGVVWRAVPALALVAVLAVALFLSVNVRAPQGLSLSDEALVGASDEAGVEHVVFADRRTLSSDEVLTTIISSDDREATR